jgi:hypothetical protein
MTAIAISLEGFPAGPHQPFRVTFESAAFTREDEFAVQITDGEINIEFGYPTAEFFQIAKFHRFQTTFITPGITFKTQVLLGCIHHCFTTLQNHPVSSRALPPSRAEHPQCFSAIPLD